MSTLTKDELDALLTGWDRDFHRAERRKSLVLFAAGAPTGIAVTLLAFSAWICSAA